MVARSALRADLLRELVCAPAGPLARLEVVETSGSTNSDLLAALAAEPAAWPDRSAFVADHQAAGRGRAGRVWQTPPRAALTVSFLLRPSVPVRTFGWLPVLAGLAVVQVLRATVGVESSVKWPNDVLVSREDHVPIDGWGTGRKIAGILSEVAATPAGPAAVIGLGLNVSQTQAELPVPTATSLAVLGIGSADREMLLVALANAVTELGDRWRDAGGDAHAAGLDAECAAVSATLGRSVAVELPGGQVLAGVAEALAEDGALLVRTRSGVLRTVSAGDVHHVRTGGVN